MWFILYIINLSSLNYNFQDIYFREFKEKKGPDILLRPGIRSLCLLSRSALLDKSFQSGTNCLLHRLCRKKKLTVRRTKRFNIIKNNYDESEKQTYLCQTIELSDCGTSGLSEYQTVGLTRLSDYSYVSVLDLSKL